MSNNRTFFKNVKAGRMSIKDIFSDALKKHSPEESARVLIAGTPLTTPTEAEMLSGWQKPFLFFRFFLASAIVCALGYWMFQQFRHVGGLFLILVVMAVAVNLTLLLLSWEMNVPRNISLYEVLGICAIGGGLSIIATLILGQFDTSTGAQWAILTEEPAKVLIVYLLLAKTDRKYILNGMLLGMAVGAGFAVIETLFYIFNFAFQEGLATGLQVAILRALVAVNGHGIWAALEGGGLVLAKGREKLRPEHLIKPPFLLWFFTACVLHYLHNSDMGISMGLAKYALLSLAALLAFLFLLKKGVNEIVEISAAHNGGRVTAAVNRTDFGSDLTVSAGAYLEAVAGTAAGKTCPIRDGQSLLLGRGTECDIALSGESNVSSKHCRIAMSGGELYITDLGSTNGTYVAGHRLNANQSVSLADGDVIYLGSRNCAFRVSLR